MPVAARASAGQLGSARLGARTTGDRAFVLMAILVVAVAFVHFDFLGVFKPLEDSEVVSCDGKA